MLKGRKKSHSLFLPSAVLSENQGRTIGALLGLLLGQVVF